LGETTDVGIRYLGRAKWWAISLCPKDATQEVQILLDRIILDVDIDC
jgi:hypothetical protein